MLVHVLFLDGTSEKFVDIWWAGWHFPLMEPIGFIKSCFKEKFGTPRQPTVVPESTAFLKIRSDLNPREALSGLEKFSHVWIIFQFHKNSNKKFYAKVAPPRLNGETIGVFATRSPHRPNPIGLSCVKLDRIEGDTLYFSGVDLIEGTPVLDLKPYIPFADSVPDAKAGWVGAAEPKKLNVQFSEVALKDLETFSDKKLKTMIEQILENDPRNFMDKEVSRESKVLGFFLADTNVLFSVEVETATVLRVEPRETSRLAQSPTNS
jgi:tRNA (adenine37-N6)-methyltransferase